MPGHRTPLATICLAISLTIAGCAGGSTSPTGPTPFSTPPAPTAPLMVQVDSICVGQESNIRVFVDKFPIGVTNPGEPGVSEVVTIGQHQLSAISQRGTEWGPFPTTVTAAGTVERLGCMPTDGI